MSLYITIVLLVTMFYIVMVFLDFIEHLEYKLCNKKEIISNNSVHEYAKESFRVKV